MTAFLDSLLTLLVLAFALASLRLARGPSLADRVVALDVIAALAVALLALAAVRQRLPVLLDAALLVSLVSFVGTVAFARLIERRSGR